MSEIRYNIGDSVWFKFDHGRREQKGQIKWYSEISDYAILGNVDNRIHFVKEDEISIIAPHKRWLDPTEYKPNWEEQIKAIKKLQDFKIDDEVLYYDGTHCNRNIRTGVITRIDYNPLYLYYEYRVRKLFTTISSLRQERDIICKTRDAEEYSKKLGINLEPFVRATNEYERHQAMVKDALKKWKPTISNIDYSSMYPGIPADCQLNVPLDNSSWGISTPIGFGLNVNTTYFDDILKEDKPMEENKKMVIRTVTYKREIKDIIFSGPATVIKFNNQFDKEEKTVVKCQNGDEFDKTKGFLLALVKEFVDKKSWNNILRIIDTFEEEKEKDIVKDEISKTIKDIVKDDIVDSIRDPEDKPERKFFFFDVVTFKSKGSHHYSIDNYRWNPKLVCWEYRIYNHVSHRWYEESRLVLVKRAININDIVKSKTDRQQRLLRVVDKNLSPLLGDYIYELEIVNSPDKVRTNYREEDLVKLYDSSSEIAKSFR